MKRSSDARERDTPNRQHRALRNHGVQDSEIDQILADSFPASDPPPWTLGVTRTPVDIAGKPTRRRRWLRR